MKYLITLTPENHFFFGGQQTLSGEKNKDGDDGEVSYLARSRNFPQQTTILGMLRYTILGQRGVLNHIGNITKGKVGDAQKLIGEKSFKLCSKDIQDFGIIKSISPVFIVERDSGSGKQHTSWIPYPFGNEFKYAGKENGKSSTNLDSDKSYTPVLEGYKAKDGYKRAFVSDKAQPKNIDDFFIDDFSVGITKKDKDRNENDNKGFYKQYFKRFAKDCYAFAFYLEIDESISDDIVLLGGERCLFKMECKEITNDNGNYDSLCKKVYDQINNQDCKRIILTNNAYITDNSIFDHSNFAITEIITFKNIRAETNTKYKYSKNEWTFSFLKRGSVFFFEDDEQKSKILEILSDENLRNIGYNHYAIIGKGDNNNA